MISLGSLWVKILPRISSVASHISDLKCGPVVPRDLSWYSSPRWLLAQQLYPMGIGQVLAELNWQWAEWQGSVKLLQGAGGRKNDWETNVCLLVPSRNKSSTRPWRWRWKHWFLPMSANLVNVLGAIRVLMADTASPVWLLSDNLFLLLVYPSLPPKYDRDCTMRVEWDLERIVP